MFWIFRAYFREPLFALENLLDLYGTADGIQLRAQAHHVAGCLEYFLGSSAALFHARESERLSIELGPAGIAELSVARNLLNDIALHHEHDPMRAFEGAKANLPLLQEVGDRWSIAHAITMISSALWISGDPMGSQRACEQSLALFRECGDVIRAAQQSIHLAVIALEKGEYEQARKRCEEVLTAYRQMPVNFAITVPLWMLGVIAVRQGDYARAKAWYAECVHLDNQMGVLTQYRECLIGFAGIAHAEKRYGHAVQILSVVSRETSKYRLEHFDHVELQRLTNVLREELGDERFQEFADQGRNMTLEQAIAFALES
jgi:hypothetical protein